MGNVLFGVDSMFQFIIATNIRTTIYKDWKAGTAWHPYRS